jgi:predicted Fe-Mo cluster-binding NifX family protein
MSKIGFTTLLDRKDSVLSPHFGMAKWVMIRDDDTGEVTFEQNTGLYGRAVVDILQRHGCSDAVFAEIGPGALRHLQEAGIRGWLAPTDVPVPELLDRFSRGDLASAKEPTRFSGGAGRREHRDAGMRATGGMGIDRGRGCCGQQRHRHGRGEEPGADCRRTRRTVQPTT